MADSIIVYNNQAMANNGSVLTLQNLAPENIKSGVNIGGIVGTFAGEPVKSKFVQVNLPSSSTTSITITDVPFTVKKIVANVISATFTATLDSVYGFSYNGGLAETYRKKILYYGGSQYNYRFFSGASAFTLTQTGTTVTIDLGTTGYIFPASIRLGVALSEE